MDAGIQGRAIIDNRLPPRALPWYGLHPSKTKQPHFETTHDSFRCRSFLR